MPLVAPVIRIVLPLMFIVLLFREAVYLTRARVTDDVGLNGRHSPWPRCTWTLGLQAIDLGPAAPVRSREVDTRLDVLYEAATFGMPGQGSLCLLSARCYVHCREMHEPSEVRRCFF